MSIAPIKGLFETHLTVSDIGRSIACYQEIVGLPLAHQVSEAGENRPINVRALVNPLITRAHATAHRIRRNISLENVVASVDRLRHAE